jgi:phospholipid-binding lipoprotein MlaA
MNPRLMIGMVAVLAMALILPVQAFAGQGQVAPVKSSPGKSLTAGDDLDEYSSTPDIPDPIRPVNRGIFWVNHQLYHYVFHHALKVYQIALPKQVRTGIFNVFDNLEYPDRFVNDLLQARFDRAGRETGKFLVNSTAGVGGIFKVSQHIPWMADVPPEDTGLTFARWGIGHGPYLILPVLGPRSLRDTVGYVGDYALSPCAWLFFIAPGAVWPVALTTPDSVRSADQKISNYELVTRNALDRYIAVRTSYAQNRKLAGSR